MWTGEYSWGLRSDAGCHRRVRAQGALFCVVRAETAGTESPEIFAVRSGAVRDRCRSCHLKGESLMATGNTGKKDLAREADPLQVTGARALGRDRDFPCKTHSN
jgi:hypothetical protein